jgi:hypothetical protein
MIFIVTLQASSPGPQACGRDDGGATHQLESNCSEALQPEQRLVNCFAHGTVNRASTTTNSAETVSATSGAAIDREKMNMAAPYAKQNINCSLRIAELDSITVSRRHWRSGYAHTLLRSNIHTDRR